MFAVTALYAEFFDAAAPLPEHDVLFERDGDADLCARGYAICAGNRVANARARDQSAGACVCPPAAADAQRLGKLRA